MLDLPTQPEGPDLPLPSGTPLFLAIVCLAMWLKLIIAGDPPTVWASIILWTLSFWIGALWGLVSLLSVL